MADVRRWWVLGCAAALVGWSAPALAAAPPAPAPTAADLGVDFPAEMAAVVAARSAPALDDDRRALATDLRRSATATARRTADIGLLADADALVVSGTATLAAARSALSVAVVTEDARASAVVGDHRRLAAIAVELYADPDGGAEPVTGDDDLVQAQEAQSARTLVTVVVGGQEHALDVDVATLATDRRIRRTDAGRAGAAAATLARVGLLRADRAAVLAQDATAVTATAAEVVADRSVLGADLTARAVAVATVAEPPGAPQDGSTTVLGGSALSVPQLVDWYDTQGYVDLTSAPIGQLAGWYLSEGATEGVRGDVAFAQAVVETAGFSSPDAVARNNYAGIGHCDTCATGTAFPSPQLGVRQQIQLLRGFADLTLTTAQLADPPVSAAAVPEDEPDRGCCVTWQSLTGHWATDPSYGHTIMSVYQSMLADVLPPPVSG